MTTRISKIVSGGQTGADIGALDAAIYTKTEHGGWSPKGKKQEKGKIIPKKYHLKEMPTADYLKRNEANVVDSDATLILTYGPLRVLFGIQENESTFGMPRHVNRSRKGLPAKK